MQKMAAKPHKGLPGQPKHRQVYEHLERAIISGKYKLGDRIPSETAIVRQFDVSRPTAARALRDLEVAKLVERRHGSGTYVTHSPDAKGGALGLLVPGLGQGEIFEPICNGIAQAVRPHGFSLHWGHFSAAADGHNVARVAEKSQAICRDYIDGGVAGVFFQPIELAEGMAEANRHIAELLEKAGVPVVLIDADYAEYPQRSRFDLVGIDNRRAGYVQTSHLLELGRRRVHYLGLANSAATIDARIDGYRAALFDRGVDPRREWVHRVEKIDVEFAKAILAGEPPDAIVCGTDFTAGQVMRDLARLGVRIPDDVAVVGIDDLKYAAAMFVPLTTIHQPCAAIAAAAVETMAWRISRPAAPARTVLLDFELVIRESTRKPGYNPE